MPWFKMPKKHLASNTMVRNKGKIHLSRSDENTIIDRIKRDYYFLNDGLDQLVNTF